MQIQIAEHSGFCEGVERAFRIALDTRREGRPEWVIQEVVKTLRAKSS